MTERQKDLPVGDPVPPLGGLHAPERKALAGRAVALRPVDPAADAEALHACSHGDRRTEELWTYMGNYGPFGSVAAMGEWLEGCAASDDPLFLTVIENETGSPVGMVSFLNIVPEMRRLELGHIWYAPKVQRSKVNTESIYLMLRESFDALRCRRVEWKCNALNARSRKAALRLGFSFEGVFRQHMIIKGRNRDTAWFAMLDSEWPAVKANMERWLYGDEEGLSLGALNEALKDT
jgi:RimJ/RimL family protein N-acetyltransferase